MDAKLAIGGLVALAVSLAGCTGTFDIEQTEPIRLQVDGQEEEARLSADGGAEGDTQVQERAFLVETEEDDEMVVVVVQVTKVRVEDADPGAPQPDNDTGDANQTQDADDAGDAAPAVIMVIVQDRDTGEELAQERVEATEEDQPREVSLDVDVKGRNNVVIVTQAVEGAADVNVAAQSGQGNVGGDAEMEEAETTATTTTNNTTTTSPTNNSTY